MARPRVFVSSTYFDLRVVRADLERFIKEVGYEPVLFERGHVPYGREEALENYCYREIHTCDIIITIIGGKYGSQSRDQQHSITQKELKTAVELGKQIYIFIEKSVASEYRTYLANKDVEGFQPTSVNDIRVYKFIEEIYALPSGNPIEAFEISEDITWFLKEQWAGLFQRLMQEESRQKEVKIIDNLQSTAATLKNLVTFLSDQREKGDGAIKDILLSSHPAFAEIKRAASIPYRVVFYDLDELKTLLEARQFKFDEEHWFSDSYDWDHPKMKKGVRVKKSIFDDQGKLKIITPESWEPDAIATYTIEPPANDDDDDIPF